MGARRNRRRRPVRRRRRERRSALLAVLVIVPVILAGVLVALGAALSAPSPPSTGADPERPAPPNAGRIDPGDLISDALFFDDDAMSAGEIQAFLDERVGECRNGACLNVATSAISSREERVSSVTGRTICGAIEGGDLAVSEVIFRVQQACGISARVILVTLQKEQSLVEGRAARSPSAGRLDAAMGASCPDSAPCDPAHSGVGPQIVAGATHLASYRASEFMRQPGVHHIAFHPNGACGGADVAIANHATAALYNYTPYQPNAAALQAGWGTGDGCSSYGNRNFAYYFALWFGSTH